jgi:hypothetical protein
VEHLINKAGRQRMLTERMMKSYVQIVSEVTPQAAAGALADAIGMFDRQLGELKASAADGDTRSAIAESERTWDRFRSIVALPCTRERVHEVRTTGERLVQSAERATAAFVRHATSTAARLVNLAGRQRMLCQRIAKDHLLIAERFGNGGVRHELTFACVDFGRALADLRASPANTAVLREELTEVASSWRTLLELVRTDSSAHDKVLACAEDVLQRMEHVTALYQSSGK